MEWLLRVPTKMSLVDLVVDLEQNVTVTQVNDAFKNADLSGVLDVEEAPLVSVDFNTNPHSAIIDSQSTMVMGQNKAKLSLGMIMNGVIRIELLK